MVPADQLSAFLSIFEEARYSDHTIDASHRDRALQTLNAIVQSLTVALGEEGSVSRKELVGLYESKPRQASLLQQMVRCVKLELLRAKARTSKFEAILEI